jgi:hypothetical protein
MNIEIDSKTVDLLDTLEFACRLPRLSAKRIVIVITQDSVGEDLNTRRF